MNPALWISKTGLDAQTKEIAVISHNLANASTVGFKKSRAVFEDLLYQNINQPGGRSAQDTEMPSGIKISNIPSPWIIKSRALSVLSMSPWV